jgi:hypothetical protein
VFRADPRTRVFIRVDKDEAQKFVDYVNAANKIAADRAAGAFKAAGDRGVTLAPSPITVYTNDVRFQPDASGMVVLELDFVGM